MLYEVITLLLYRVKLSFKIMMRHAHYNITEHLNKTAIGIQQENYCTVQ